MKDFLKNNQFVLAEAAVIEKLRRRADVKLHDRLVHSTLIYDAVGREALACVYREYINVSLEHNIPILVSTPTWRANKDRVINAGVESKINKDNAVFLRNLIDDLGASHLARVGGVIGCANDCYLPNEALEVNEAFLFHQWQVDELANGGVDFLEAVTLPSVKEAKGIALAMEQQNIPYILSFVIGADGKILDGTSLADAFSEIDAVTKQAPIGYFVNCSYPTFLKAELQDVAVFDRLLGIQANASALEHHELDGASELKKEPIAEWGELMLDLHRSYGVKVLGGCCGTDGEHLRYLASNAD